MVQSLLFSLAKKISAVSLEPHYEVEPQIYISEYMQDKKFPQPELSRFLRSAYGLAFEGWRTGVLKLCAFTIGGHVRAILCESMSYRYYMPQIKLDP